jgi:hypothetical protein
VRSPTLDAFKFVVLKMVAQGLAFQRVRAGRKAEPHLGVLSVYLESLSRNSLPGPRVVAFRFGKEL